MNTDRPDRRPGADDAFDRRVTELAAHLRDGGVEPARDLWPSIAQALAAPADPARRRRRPEVLGRWSAVALAATIVLVVGLGVGGLRQGPAGGSASTGSRPGAGAPDRSLPLRHSPLPGPDLAAAPARAAGPQAAREGLHAVEAAGAELRAALEQAPDDTELSRLVMMIHHTRGRLLRLQAGEGARVALRGRG